MNEAGCDAAAKHAFERFGRYHANEKAWIIVTNQLLEEGAQDLARMDPVRFASLVRVLAEDARVTRGSFWEDLTEKVEAMLQEQATLQELMVIADLYAKISAWNRPIFRLLQTKVRQEQAVHWMAPSDLVALLDTFSRAGSGSADLSPYATQLFNELEDRILEDFEDFDVEDCLLLLASMARFGAVKVNVLHRIGRECLHPVVSEGQLHGPRAAGICSAYGQLGYRHDTVFKAVVEEVLSENNAWQAARVLGDKLPTLRYSASDIGRIALAMLRNKMYRGNTTWFAWTNKYKEMLNVLNRRVEAEMSSMDAEGLAATSFALGRARRGSNELYKAMFARMVHLLDGSPEAAQQPQEFLERFLHGLAMMGPDRQKKDIDAEWLMQWLCNNVYTFVLSDFILVNRHLVMMRCHDKEYLQMLVPFFCDPERMKQLTKTDVQELTHAYNGARIREDDCPDGLGRHFFWALGRQYQRHQIEGKASGRPAMRRIG